MKRDPRLRGLSSEHHQALVLARTLSRAAAGDELEAARRELAARFDVELEPHFVVEDEVLLPALRERGELDLVARTEADHRYLREGAARAARGETAHLADYAERLVAHVRFEERELFPRVEELLPEAILEEVFRRAPKDP